MNKFKLAYSAGVVLLAAFCAMAIGAVVIKAVGASPMLTYLTIVTGPVQDLFGVTEVLVGLLQLIFKE